MNAIIIAAGTGSRLRPLTYEIPKPLINIFGKPMLERNIEYLIENGVKEIVIVVGYLKEKFEHLEKKYNGVKLIFNDKFFEYNNIYSFYLARNYLEDSYVIEGDIFITNNIFEKNITVSKYFSKKLDYRNEEWQLILKNNKVENIEIGGENNYIMSGISFFKKEDTQLLKELVEEYVKDEYKLKNYYWDHIVKENIEKFDIEIRPLNSGEIYEIDNLEELKALDSSYKKILNKVKTAVILAAGRSKDFLFPNGIIKIGDKKIIERSIELLMKNGITNIILVVGYEKKQYYDLAKNYSEITIIENDEYLIKGSYFSLLHIKKVVKEDILLLDSDIIYEERVLKKLINNIEKNIIIVSDEKGQKEESFVEEKDGYLYRISKDKRELKNIQGEMLGIAKISFELLQNIFKLNIENLSFAYEYAISECVNKNKIKILKIDSLLWGEIDTKEHLEYVVKKVYPKLLKVEEKEKFNEIEKIIIENLKIKKEDIENIEALGGMTNRNYLIEINGQKYVFRKPGEGTEKIIDRKNEKFNADSISKLKLDSKLIFFDDTSGIKISEYIVNAQTLNPIIAKDNLKDIAHILKKLHTSDLKFNNKFDVFREIENYEKLSIELNGVFYKNYKEVKKEVMKLKSKLEELNIELKPCHNDTVPENFIKSKKNIYLIDWEYSGMNDPLWDLAAHIIECGFEVEEEERFLNYYFESKIDREILLRIEIHKICQDFLWSIWTVLKEAKGVSFGEYGIKRFKNVELRLKGLYKYE